MFVEPEVGFYVHFWCILQRLWSWWLATCVPVLGADNWCCRDCWGHRARVSSSSSNWSNTLLYWNTGHADVVHKLVHLGPAAGILGIGPEFGTHFGWGYTVVLVVVGCIQHYCAFHILVLGKRFVRVL